MYYYAKLNESCICTEIIARGQKLKDSLKDYIKINDYNESLLYRKYVDNQWSQETFESQFENLRLQENINELERQNNSLAETVAKLTIENKKKDSIANTMAKTIADLNIRINKLEKEGK